MEKNVNATRNEREGYEYVCVCHQLEIDSANTLSHFCAFQPFWHSIRLPNSMSLNTKRQCSDIILFDIFFPRSFACRMVVVFVHWENWNDSKLSKRRNGKIVAIVVLVAPFSIVKSYWHHNLFSWSLVSRIEYGSFVAVVVLPIAWRSARSNVCEAMSAYMCVPPMMNESTLFLLFFFLSRQIRCRIGAMDRVQCITSSASAILKILIIVFMSQSHSMP